MNKNLNSYLRNIAGVDKWEEDWNLVNGNLLRLGATLVGSSEKEGARNSLGKLLERNQYSLGICEDGEKVRILQVKKSDKILILLERNGRIAKVKEGMGNEVRLNELEVDPMHVELNKYRIYYCIAACLLGRYDQNDILARSSLQLLVYCGLSSDTPIYFGFLSQLLLIYSLLIHPSTDLLDMLQSLSLSSSSLLSSLFTYFTTHKSLLENTIEDSVARCVIVLNSSGVAARTSNQLTPMFQLHIEEMKQQSSSWDIQTLFNKQLSLTLATLSCINSCRSAEDSEFSDTKIWISLKSINL